MPETTEPVLAAPTSCTAIAQRILIVMAAGDQSTLPIPLEVRYRHDDAGLRVTLATEDDYEAWRTWLEPDTMGHDFQVTETFRFAYGTAYGVPVMLSWMAVVDDAQPAGSTDE